MTINVNSPYVRASWRLLMKDKHFTKRDGYFPSKLSVGDLQLWRRQEYIVFPTSGTVSHLVKQRVVLWRPHHWKITISVVTGSMKDDVTKLFPGGVAEGYMWVYKAKVVGSEYWEKDMLFLKMAELINIDQFETLPVPGSPALCSASY